MLGANGASAGLLYFPRQHPDRLPLAAPVLPQAAALPASGRRATKLHSRPCPPSIAALRPAMLSVRAASPYHNATGSVSTRPGRPIERAVGDGSCIEATGLASAVTRGTSLVAGGCDVKRRAEGQSRGTRSNAPLRAPIDDNIYSSKFVLSCDPCGSCVRRCCAARRLVRSRLRADSAPSHGSWVLHGGWDRL